MNSRLWRERNTAYGLLKATFPGQWHIPDEGKQRETVTDPAERSWARDVEKSDGNPITFTAYSIPRRSIGDIKEVAVQANTVVIICFVSKNLIPSSKILKLTPSGVKQAAPIDTIAEIISKKKSLVSFLDLYVL